MTTGVSHPGDQQKALACVFFFYQCNLSPHCQHISPLCVQKHSKVNLSAGDAAARTAKPQFECLLACLSEGVRHEWPRLSLRRGD